MRIKALLALAVSTTALSACAAYPSYGVEVMRESTPYTLATDQPLTPEQQAMGFDKADLSIKVIPDEQAIEAVAVLTFTAKAPLEDLVVDLDTLLAISSVKIDGVERPVDSWSNPDGRLTVALGRTLAQGQSVELSVAYAGRPRVAPKAPWDGGFVWSTAPSGEPWIATA
ncbi:hypothetical protein LTR94_025241, partial [Friedmanniomyces endolithicus]